MKVLMFFLHTPVNHFVYSLNSSLTLLPWRLLIQMVVSLLLIFK